VSGDSAPDRFDDRLIFTAEGLSNGEIADQILLVESSAASQSQTCVSANRNLPVLPKPPIRRSILVGLQPSLPDDLGISWDSLLLYESAGFAVNLDIREIDCGEGVSADVVDQESGIKEHVATIGVSQSRHLPFAGQNI
jgi:hypothetical protein